MMMKRKAPARPTYIQAVDEKRQLLQGFFTRNDCFSDTMNVWDNTHTYAEFSSWNKESSYTDGDQNKNLDGPESEIIII